MPGCRSLTRSGGDGEAVGGGGREEEEAAVHLEPAKHIPADVTSRGVAGKQGGRHTCTQRERECVCVLREGRGKVVLEGWRGGVRCAGVGNGGMKGVGFGQAGEAHTLG